ncbi:MAG: SMP-30/gluconolactonase/LRE family protein [Planctomycetota bacterium]|jgi:hypothetical protein
MNTSLSCFVGLVSTVVLASFTTAQIPDGWYVYGAFNTKYGKIGVFTSHPRTAGTPLAIANLQGDLTVTGSSCILYRKRDGAILVGERTPVNSSIDLHVIHLKGQSVFVDACFSLGTGGSCCGEIAQMGLLSDERVVVAVTDVAAGPLKNIKTTLFGWQGIGIVNTKSGLVTPITVTNSAQIIDVFNGLAIAPDEKSKINGDIWQVPITGGKATLFASVPVGLSNLAFDDAGNLWVTGLDATRGLYRVDKNGKVTKVPQTNGSMNAIAFDSWTGTFAVLSANAGKPVRSVFWMEPSGKEHLLTNPGLGTLSGIAFNPNPEVIGAGTPGSATYDFKRPSPGGMPLLGNANFSLTVVATQGVARPGLAAFGTGRLPQPILIGGAQVHLDPAKILAVVSLPYPSMTLSLPVPNDKGLIGFPFFVQTFHTESSTKAATSPALEMSVL